MQMNIVKTFIDSRLLGAKLKSKSDMYMVMLVDRNKLFCNLQIVHFFLPTNKDEA